MKYLFLVLLCVAALTATATAQQAVAPSRVTAEVIAASSTTIVKGAPFSAEAVSESSQVLADGNKISRTFTVRMYRDSEGRFRREPLPASTGAITARQTISIFDPVANYRYLIDQEKKTVRRIPSMPGKAEGAVIVNGQPLSQAMRTRIETDAAQRSHVILLPSVVATTNGEAGKSESLGTRSFDGIEAEGTRTVTTIAAGTIGNERPIEIVYEKWYSKELQMIVYSRHSDPRTGEQVYRLENISRSEPDRSLFTPPSDYKVISEPTFTVTTPRPAMIPRTPGAVTTTRPVQVQ
ncbi:MAG: hypothetical protein M3384_10790 [Acidobacteriota bacterium]|nr:hypothetical protein [Acidobacteriota bacterium]